MNRGFLFTVEALLAISMVVLASASLMMYYSSQEGAYLGAKDRNSMDYALMKRYSLDETMNISNPGQVSGDNYVCEKMYKYNVSDGSMPEINKCSVIN